MIQMEEEPQKADDGDAERQLGGIESPQAPKKNQKIITSAFSGAPVMPP